MSEDQKSSVTVRIAGEEHVIRASAEPEYTRACARFVDERIMEVREQAGLIEGHKAAILAAMSIADEFFQARDELGGFRKEVTSRATNLLRRIESELDDDDEEEPASDPPETSGPSGSTEKPGTGGQPELDV